MKKLTVIKTVNAALLVSVLTQSLTGLALFFHIGDAFFELIEEVHEYNGLLMIALVAAHIFLFWPIVRQHYLPKNSVF